MLYAEKTASIARPTESGTVFCAPAAATPTTVSTNDVITSAAACGDASVARDLALISSSRLLVLPVAFFPFGDPLDGLLDSLVARGIGLRPGDPLDIFGLRAGRERVEDARRR